MKDKLKELVGTDPASLILLGIIVALFVAVLGHVLYLAGIVMGLITLVVGATFFIGARHGNKPCNDKDGPAGGGPES